MKLKTEVLAGDGIGPGSHPRSRSNFKAVAEFGGHDFTFTEALIGGVAITAANTPLPQETIDTALDSDAVLPWRSRRQQVQRARPAGQTSRSRPPANPPGSLGGFAQPSPLDGVSRARRKFSATPRGHQRRRHPLRSRTPRRTLFRRAALVEQGKRRSHQHHALHPRRSVPRRPRSIRARAKAPQKTHVGR